MIDIQYDPETKVISRPAKTPFVVHPGGVGQYIWDHVKSHGSSVAQIQAETGEKQTFQEIILESVRVALRMRKLGVGPGDIVSMCIRNHFHATSIFNATQFIGAISASTDPTISTKDNEHLMDLVKPKIVFFDLCSTQMMVDVFKGIDHTPIMVCLGDDDAFVKFSSFLEPTDGEVGFKPVYVEEKDIRSTCAMFFSSGTTGLPKAMCLGHNYVLHNVKRQDGDKSVGNVKSIISYTSFYWISKLNIHLYSVRDGLVQILCEAFHPEQFWEYQEKYEVEILFAAPVMLAMILQSVPQKFTTKLKYILAGGSATAPEYLIRLRELLPNTLVLNGYGQTESGMSLGFMPSSKHLMHKLASCGIPHEGYTLKIVDPDTEEALGFGKEGEIRIFHHNMLNGYHKQDSSGCFDKEGFFKTGDVGYYDEDFCFFITDRIKEMFKYQSWHVVPLKIEQVLATHPAVKIATVIGIPHATDDHHALGVVVKNQGAEVTAEELVKHVKENLDKRHWLHAGVRFVDEMPLTPTGKVKRRTLKDMLLKDL